MIHSDDYGETGGGELGNMGGITAAQDVSGEEGMTLVPLQSAASDLHESYSRAVRNGQEQLDLSSVIHKGPHSAAHFYQLDKHSKFRVRDVGSAVKWIPCVQAVDSVPLPRELRAMRPECQSQMGLLPEINRAWIAIDNRLFLWNYYKGESFYAFEGLDQLVVAVGLARPRPGVFSADVEFVLVVSTPVEVVLLTLHIEGDQVHGDIRLEPTQFNMASDNVPMRCISGTRDGRIFMGGHDGMLYEFVYESGSLIHSLGLKRQCRKVERSGSMTAKWLVPEFIRNAVSGTPQPIMQLAVDHERALLWTLAEDSAGFSTLSLYRLNNKNNKDNCGVFQVGNTVAVRMLFDKFLTENTIGVKQAGMRKGEYGAGGAKGIRIVSLDVVSKNESQGIHLVIISDRGVRIYLTTRAGGKDGMRLSVEHVRGPPSNAGLRAYEQRVNASIGVTNNTSGFGPHSTSLLAARQHQHPHQHQHQAQQGFGFGVGSYGLSAAQEPPEEGVPPSSGTEKPVETALYSGGVTLMSSTPVGDPLQILNNLDGSAFNQNGAGSSGQGLNGFQSLTAFSVDNSMRTLSPQHETFQRFPSLTWKQEAFHEVLDLDVLNQGAASSQGSLPVGRVWAMVEISFDPGASEDQEGIYSHMLVAPPISAESSIFTSRSSMEVTSKNIGGIGASVNGENASITGNKRPASSMSDSSSTKQQLSAEHVGAAVALSELARQHVLPRRYFIVLTSNGLWILVKNQPVNQLHALLQGPDPGTNADIEEFFKQYGLDEACAMCLAIAAKTSFGEEDPWHTIQRDEAGGGGAADGGGYGPFGASYAPGNDEATQSKYVARRAALWFRRIGYGIMSLSSQNAESGMQNRLPCFQDHLPVNNNYGGGGMATPGISDRHGQYQGFGAHQPHGSTGCPPNAVVVSGGGAGGSRIQHSGCFSGLSLHLSRLLRPFWNWTVTVGAEQTFAIPGDTPVLRCRWNREQISMLATPVVRLKRFMASQAPFAEAIREHGNGNSGHRHGGGFGAGHSNRVGLPGRTSALSTENAQIARLYALLDRTIQALLLFDILQASSTLRFAKLVSLADLEARSLLDNMTWAELVTTNAGKVVACALVKVLVEKSAHPATRELVASLEAQCPAFFSQGDALTFAAFEEIALAEQAGTASERDARLKAALEQLRAGFRKTTAGAGGGDPGYAHVTRNALRDACDKFERLGKPDSAVGLALFCASCFTKRLDVLPVRPQRQQQQQQRRGQEVVTTSNINGETLALEMREFCYEIVLAILSRTMPNISSGSIGSNKDGANDMGSEERTLRQALDSGDALWHFTLYRWLLERGHKQHLLSVNSPFIVKFLRDPKANDPRKAGPNVYQGPLHTDIHILLQAEWYGKHGGNANAALVMQHAAKLDGQYGATNSLDGSFEANGDVHVHDNPNLDQRIQYYAKALNYAKASQDSGSGGNMDELENSNSSGDALQGLDIARLKDELDIARVQKEVVYALQEAMQRYEEELKRCTPEALATEASVELADEVREMRKALETLTWQLRNPSDLYNDFAYRFSLWETCIQIMKECDYTDNDELQTMYRNILQHAATSCCGAELQQLIPVLAATVVELGQKFYQESSSSFVFPYEYLIQGLEDLSTFYVSPSQLAQQGNINNGVGNGISSGGEWNPWVQDVMLQVGVSFERLLIAYSNYNKKIQHGTQPLGLAFLGDMAGKADPEWYSERSKFHVAWTIVKLVQKWRGAMRANDTDILHDARVENLLEHQRVIVDGLHGNEVTQQNRNKLKMELAELIGKIHS